MDCGDHSCLFAKDKSGQRTNGGCRCLDGLTFEHRRDVKLKLAEQEAEIAQLRTRLSQAESERDGYKKMWDERHPPTTSYERCYFEGKCAHDDGECVDMKDGHFCMYYVANRNASSALEKEPRERSK